MSTPSSWLVAGIFGPLPLVRLARLHGLGLLFAPPARLLGKSETSSVAEMAGRAEP